MQIREGGYYKQRNGTVRGPMQIVEGEGFTIEETKSANPRPMRWRLNGQYMPRSEELTNENVDFVEELAVFPMPELSPRDNTVANDEDGYILEFASDYYAASDDDGLYLFTRGRLLDMLKVRDGYNKRMVSLNVSVDTTEAREKLREALEQIGLERTMISHLAPLVPAQITNISPRKIYSLAAGLAQSITDDITVQGFENDRDAATVLANQKKTIESAIAERLLNFLNMEGVSTFHDGGVVKGPVKTGMSEHATDSFAFTVNAKSWAEGGYTATPGLKPNEVAGVIGSEKVAETYSEARRKVAVSLEDFRNKAKTILGKGKPEEFIVAAAIHHGGIISLPKPARHHTILQTLDTEMQIGGVINPQQQGFITSTGRYVNRTEAWYIALAAGQITRKTSGEDSPNLYSEDLW